MENLVLLVHVVAAVAIIVLVLLQHGKGADMGAAFGSGSAGSIFGSAGSANFLSRSTASAAVVFFATSLTLTYLAAHRKAGGGLMEGVGKEPAAVTAPAKVDGNTIPATVPVQAPSAPAQKGNEIPK